MVIVVTIYPPGLRDNIINIKHSLVATPDLLFDILAVAMSVCF